VFYKDKVKVRFTYIAP